ncbi:MAG: lasso peptide biosynthesis B2 protein [Sterolibacteriaceae bacterium]|nr:lasso peptide biosynthesis B2 protein [Candidatus Methylophosphatis haderslevensis]
MRKISKFLRLRFSKRWLLLKAAMLLSTVRISLWLFGYQSVRPLVERGCALSPRLFDTAATAEEMAWAVAQVGSVVPGGRHCLSQALALRVFLARRGVQVDVSFGVRRGPDSLVIAHAWIEHDGRILIGGTNLDSFVRLTSPHESRVDLGSASNRVV